MAKPSGRPIRSELIDVATDMIRRVGVNGFSYGDLARELGIKAPSIHHHFRAKEDLVAEVAARYRAHFRSRVDSISADDVPDRLRAYAELFSATDAAEDLCLCGAVAADWRAVGETSRREVDGFFDDQRTWLRDQIERGQDDGSIRPELAAADLAEAFLASLEGAMLVGRTDGDAAVAARVGSLLTDLITP